MVTAMRWGQTTFPKASVHMQGTCFSAASSMNRDPSQHLHKLVIRLGEWQSGLLALLTWARTEIPEGGPSSWLLLSQMHRMKLPLKNERVKLPPHIETEYASAVAAGTRGAFPRPCSRGFLGLINHPGTHRRPFCPARLISDAASFWSL